MYIVHYTCNKFFVHSLSETKTYCSAISLIIDLSVNLTIYYNNNYRFDAIQWYALELLLLLLRHFRQVRQDTK